MLKYSILDQCTAPQGRDPGAAMRETLAQARLAEDLGYHRYWLAEHHSNPGLVGATPEIMTTAIAMVTSRIRVGAAGVMLPHYAPYKVAEQWAMIEALAPGRIDLGLGRSPGDTAVAMALHGGPAGERDFDAASRQLLAWLENRPEDLAPEVRDARVYPSGPEASPKAWMLATSPRGAALAAELGLPLCFNFNDGGARAAEALALYRGDFRPSPRQPEPFVALSVWALTADTAAAAEHMFTTRKYWRVMLSEKRKVAMLPPDEAVAYPYSEAQMEAIGDWRPRYFIGEPADVADRIRRTADDLDVGEVVVTTWAYDDLAKRRSFELLAAAFSES